MRAFQQTFPAVIALSLLTVAMLSFGQVRRTLVPLLRLTAATRDIARQTLLRPVDISGNDELSQLGHAFNTMTRRLDEQFHTLNTLAEIDRLLLAKPDLDVLVKTVFKRLPELIRCDAVAIWVATGADHRGVLYTQRPGHELRQLPLTLTAEQAEIIYRRDGDDTGNPPLAPLSKLLTTGWHVFPMIYQQQPTGSLIIGCAPKHGATEDRQRQRRHAEDLADRLAVGCAAASREQQLHRQAYYDSLTGLPNRKLLHDILDREIARSKRGDSAVALLFLDLDNFKNINDSMGHAAGDLLLKQAAERLRGSVRASDAVARLGGDEFNLVLSSIDKPGAGR